MLKLQFLLVLSILLAPLSACTSLTAPSNSSSSTQQATSTQAASTQSTSPLAANQPFDYGTYGTILSTYVSENGRVDYKGLQANPDSLKAFNQSLGEVSPETFSAWSEAEQMAFLINAYNAFTLESIIDQKPLKKSIRDIPGVWKFRRFKVAGEEKTLDDIEHNTLRKNYKEPRVHAALNCTAISCPVLRTEPYTGDQLDTQLEEQVRGWVGSSEGLQIDRNGKRVAVSSIFKWFGEDWKDQYETTTGFVGNEKERAFLNFISQHVSEEDRAYLQKGDYKLDYLDYNWALNIQ